MRKLICTFGILAAVAGLTALPSSATFRGVNGLLVYQAQAGKHVQLFSVRPSGEDVRQLTHFADSDAVGAAVSPDGTKIAFQREFGPNKARVYTMNADGTALHEIDRTLRLVAVWRPDGKLLVIRRLRFTVVNADGSGARDAGIPAVGDSPCVLADGKHVALLVTRRNDNQRAIFIGTFGGGPGSLKRITPWEGIADKIDCSPDGTHIAFSSPEFGPPRSANVYTIGVDGTGLRQLTHAHGGQINDGLDSWSPDGKQIAFVSNSGGVYQIWTMNADGTGARQLTHAGEAHAAAWGTHP